MVWLVVYPFPPGSGDVLESWQAAMAIFLFIWWLVFVGKARAPLRGLAGRCGLVAARRLGVGEALLKGGEHVVRAAGNVRARRLGGVGCA